MKAVENSLHIIPPCRPSVGDPECWRVRRGHRCSEGDARSGLCSGEQPRVGTGRIAAPRLDLPSGGPSRMAGLASSLVAASSAATGGDWLRVAGAGLAGLGCGLAWSRGALGAVLIAMGLFFVVAAPVVMAATRSSVLGRAAGVPRSTAHPAPNGRPRTRRDGPARLSRRVLSPGR